MSVSKAIIFFHPKKVQPTLFIENGNKTLFLNSGFEHYQKRMKSGKAHPESNRRKSCPMRRPNFCNHLDSKR